MPILHRSSSNDSILFAATHTVQRRRSSLKAYSPPNLSPLTPSDPARTGGNYGTETGARTGTGPAHLMLFFITLFSSWLGLFVIPILDRTLLPALHYLCRILLLYVLPCDPIPISSSSDPIQHSCSFPRSADEIIGLLPKPTSASNDNHRAAVLITTHADPDPLSVDLSLKLASVGYHVFIQTSPSQLSVVMLRWQRLKSKLNKSLSQSAASEPSASTSLNPLSTVRSAISLVYPNLYRIFFSSSGTITGTSQKDVYSTSSSYWASSSSPPPPPRVGSIIPLLFSGHDLSRLEAVSTIAAYSRQNEIEMISVINLHHPHSIQQSQLSATAPSSPVSPTFSHSSMRSHHPQQQHHHHHPYLHHHTHHQQQQPSSQSAHDSSPISCRPLTCIPSTPPTDGDSRPGIIPDHPSTPRASTFTGFPFSHSLLPTYRPEPIPLSICSDVYLADAINDILLAPLLITQDLLPLLKAHHGRVINLWDAPKRSSSGLISVLHDSLKRISRTLHSELEALQIPVSVVYVPSRSSGLADPQFDHRLITSDIRSILTEASDPDLLRAFSKQASLRTLPQVPDPLATFAFVRTALETNFPIKAYPAGVPELITEIVDRIGFGKVL